MNGFILYKIYTNLFNFEKALFSYYAINVHKETKNKKQTKKKLKDQLFSIKDQKIKQDKKPKHSQSLHSDYLYIGNDKK